MGFPEMIVQRETNIVQDTDLKESEQGYFYNPRAAIDEYDSTGGQYNEWISAVDNENADKKTQIWR